MSMWEPEVSSGGIMIAVTWTLAPTLIIVGWAIDVEALGQLGIVVSAAAASLTVIRDNQRTRRMLQRPGEVASPLRMKRD